MGLKKHTWRDKNHLIVAEHDRITLSSARVPRWLSSASHLKACRGQLWIVLTPPQPPRPPPDPVKGPWPPSADRWQERKWRRPAAAPFTPGDRSDPSSQPGWMLLRRPYGSHKTFRFRVAVFLPQRRRLQPIKPQKWTIEPRLGPTRLADLQTATDCFRKCVGMTKIKPTQCDCVPLLSAALDGAQRR